MYVSAGHLRAIPQSSRAPFYAITILWEWLLTGYVLLGVRLHHTSLLEVTGARWKSAKEVFRDIGIAFSFWLVALIVLGLVAHLLHVSRQSVRFLAPQGHLEVFLWVAVSCTAGICEETMFRGYLQKQFIAWTRSAPAGVLLSAVAFGAGHIYQGAKSAVVITVFGLLFGILAQWRGSMRPGMLAHAWHDTLAGLVMRFAPR